MSTMIENKEFIVLNRNVIALGNNVRHAHLWGKKYDPYDLSNYDINDIIKMTKSILENIRSGNNPFDTEPVVFFDEQQDKYEIQVGNTRTICLLNIEEIIINNKEEFSEFSADEIDYASHRWDKANFIRVYYPYSDSQKRRENTVRSNQHWVATAIGMYEDSKLDHMNVKTIATSEGVSVSYVENCIKFCKAGAKLKKLAVSGAITREVAFNMANLGKNILKIVLEQVDEDTRIKDLDDLKRFISWNLTRLDSDFPTQAFDYNGVHYPEATSLPWYKVVELGMFTQAYSTDREASRERERAYADMVNAQTLLKYPNLKIYENSWSQPNSGVVTRTRECVHSIPIGYRDYNSGIINVKFHCNTPGCEVHSFELKKVDSYEIQAKESKKIINERIENLFLDENAFDSNNIVLRCNLIQYNVRKLSSDAAFLEFMEYLCNSLDAFGIEHEMNAIVSHWQFDIDLEHRAIANFFAERFTKIITMIEFINLKHSKHLVNVIESYFQEQDIQLYTAENQEAAQENADAIVDKRQTGYDKKNESNIKRRNEIFDILTHLFGVVNECPTKSAILELESSPTVNEYGNYNFVFTTVNKAVKKACRLFKIPTEVMEGNLDDLNYALNFAINDYRQIVPQDYCNQEAEDLWVIRNTNANG